MKQDSLPAAIDAKSPLRPEELEILKHQYDTEVEKGWASTQTKFNLAWGYVKSENTRQVAEGVTILMDIYKTEPVRRRECLYFLAIGHYKLRNYAEARHYNAILLEKEPTNLQAKSLESLIEGAVAKEGYVGIAIASGAVAVVGVALASILSRRR